MKIYYILCFFFHSQLISVKFKLSFILFAPFSIFRTFMNIFKLMKYNSKSITFLDPNLT